MDFKGSSSHAAQHQHGVVPRPAPPNPQTLEQRIAAIEQFIEQESGHTVAENLALSKARREQERAKLAAEGGEGQQESGEAREVS